MEESSKKFREEVGTGHREVYHQIAQHIHKINQEKMAKSNSWSSQIEMRTARESYSMPRHWDLKGGNST